MKINKFITFILIALFSITQVNAQNDADVYLKAVSGKLKKVNDYSVQANIKVDMPLIRILPTHVKIYFKQKDKFKVESKSIAIVPRQGFDQISKILADKNTYTAMIQGQETIGTIATTIVNVIPLSDSSDMVLAKLWIDPVKSVIIKSQLTTKSSGTILTEYIYGNQIEYGLPDKMIFSVDTKKFKMPKNIETSANKNDTKNNKNKENKKGKIYIDLTNYQVNKGIPDAVFKK
jgi:outer membrane lipoprotein-sorting protein